MANVEMFGAYEICGPAWENDADERPSVKPNKPTPTPQPQPEQKPKQS